jgi:hypothetical protein
MKTQFYHFNFFVKISLKFMKPKNFQLLIQYFYVYFSVNRTCSRVIELHPHKIETIALIFGRKRVTSVTDRGRKYPWAGAFFYKEEFICGGNLSKFYRKFNFNDKY